MKLKNLYEELEEKLEGATKENKRLQGELSDLEKQLNEGGLSAHEMEKAKKRVEQEKEELAQSLEVSSIFSIAGFSLTVADQIGVFE